MKIDTWKKHAGWLIPILIMALLTPFTPSWDMAASRFFYTPGTGFSQHPFYLFLFYFGPLPAEILVGAACLAWILSFFIKTYRAWRRPAACLVLAMAIGSLLIVHEAFKEHWGRPRPKQVEEFGGLQAFRPFYQPNFFHQIEPSKSFSCGHCSMGFYFFALALVGKRLHNKRLFWTGLLLALVLGILLSLARIAQGGHFLSDTLVSALVMWLTAYACDRFFYPEDTSAPSCSKRQTSADLSEENKP